MFDAFRKQMRIAGREVDRVRDRTMPYLVSGTGRKWLDLTLGMVFFVISIALALVILGEFGRETGLWVPSWDRFRMNPSMPGWWDPLIFCMVLFLTASRSYFFFRPDNGYKNR